MKKLVTAVLFLFATLITAQESKHLTLESAVLDGYKLLPEQKPMQWIQDSDNFAYNENSSLFVESASVSGKIIKTPALQLEDLQNVLPDLKRLPNTFSKITKQDVTFTNGHSIITYNYKIKTISETITYPNESENMDYSNKANAVAYTIENNLFVANSSNPKIVVTNYDNKNIVSGQAIARSEFGITKGTFWSPNGTSLAFYQKDETKVTDYPLVDINTTPAVLNNIKYPMNGMNSEIAKVGIYNLSTNYVTYLDIDTSDEHYLTNLSWSPDEAFVFLAELNRDQNHMWFNMYDVTTGKKVKTLFEEKNDKWVEPEHDAVFIPNSISKFLWLSEHDGFMNLYLYDINKGLEKQLTNYKWVIKNIIGFDSANKNVIISGTGNDARDNKVFKVSLKNGKTEVLTPESGVHQVSLSSDGNYLIDSYSSLYIPRITKIKAVNNSKERNVHAADNPLNDYQLGTTEFITLKDKNGTDLYGRIIKPANFDTSRKYPVLIYVYGGPHAQMITNSWLGGSNLWMQWMAAEKDYILFTLDNHGSESRGFDFESIIHRRLGDKEMEDQLIGVEYLKSLPFVDGNRLAIHGWSYGGFMTNSLMLRHPGVFTTAVAGGPVTDWKFYEIMYGERYMDRWQENEAGFKSSQLQNYVNNLDGKLLEIIGSIDPVVVPQHTMTLLDAFIKNNKQVDLFIYPMHPHNVRGLDRAHLMRKILDYVVENNK
ncbi:DPP IV N-terminal domain-containing protein [Gaetbulibacter aquiaggeris]|uniref:DPP IV N-terminal domain-containing protein n=1 Tax=Gaetbulibacter aquiaggeris TaxID=1735373 RepID=A0ABW7MTI5_9FLAO